MLIVILREHLRRIGPILLVLTALAAALPALSVRAVFGRGLAVDSMLVLSTAAGTSPFFPLLAFVVGLFIALTAWSTDHEGGHVYALSLPIPRWHYALLRLGAGFVLLLPAIGALALSATIVTAAVELPPSIHAYPLALSIRFFATTLVIFSLFFALAAGSKRSAAWGLLAIFLLLVADSMYQVSAGSDYSPLFNLLLAARSPLSFFFGQWSLVDV